MIASWGWQEFVVAIAFAWLLLDTHKRASRAMDAAERIERRLDELEQARDRDVWR
jgi:hypothetical protein